MTGYIFQGNALFRQTEMALALAPVRLAIPLVPPSSSMISLVVVSSIMTNRISKKFRNASPKLLPWRKNLGAVKMNAMENWRDDSGEAIAWRLKCLRYAIAKNNQTAFAIQLGIDPKRWNNFETRSPLSKDVALKIVQKWPDLSLDWLFLGRDGHLTVKRQRELIEAGNALTSAPRSETKVG